MWIAVDPRLVHRLPTVAKLDVALTCCMHVPNYKEIPDNCLPYVNRLIRDRRKLRAILRRCVASLENAGCPPEREPAVTAKRILKETKPS